MRDFLNSVFMMKFAYSTWAEFCFFVSEKLIHFTTNTDTKDWLTKEKSKTESTHYEIKCSAYFKYYNHPCHHKSHNPSNSPSKLFLRSASVFWFLILDKKSSQYHTRSIARIDKNSEGKIKKEDNNKDSKYIKILYQNSIHKSNNSPQKQESCCRSHFPFIEDKNIIVVHLFTKWKYFLLHRW